MAKIIGSYSLGGKPQKVEASGHLLTLNLTNSSAEIHVNSTLKRFAVTMRDTAWCDGGPTITCSSLPAQTATLMWPAALQISTFTANSATRGINVIHSSRWPRWWSRLKFPHQKWRHQTEQTGRPGRGSVSKQVLGDESGPWTTEDGSDTGDTLCEASSALTYAGVGVHSSADGRPSETNSTRRAAKASRRLHCGNDAIINRLLLKTSLSQ